MVAIGRVLLIAAAVRAAYLAASLLLARYLNDYDTSATLISDSCDDTWPEVVAKTQQQYPWVLWDSVFLHRISNCGYEYEQYYAFFPGLPGVVHLISSTGIISGPYAFSIVTLLLNNGLFLLSVALLARLSEVFLQDDRLVITCILFFITSPASIHHSMLYTEALFTAASWLGLYCLYCKGSSLGASLAFAVSAATRSNGLLNAGFILHEHGRNVIKAWRHNKAAAVSDAAKGATYTAITMAPYFIYTAYGYQQFCTGVYGGGNQRPWCSKLLPSAYGYVQDAYWDVGLFRYYRASQIPNFFIAAPTLILSLWGALAYMCAVPHCVITGGLLSPEQLARISSNSSGSGSSRNTQEGRGRQDGSSNTSSKDLGHSDGAVGSHGCLLWPPAVVGYTLGDMQKCTAAEATMPAGVAATVANGVQQGRIPGVAYQPLRRRQLAAADKFKEKQSHESSNGNGGSSPKHKQSCTCGLGTGYYSPRVAVFVIHWLFLTLVCLAVMHIQVATRFLSSCVPLYWFAALLISQKGGLLRWLLWVYCFAFMGLGGVYFPNFYPWT